MDQQNQLRSRSRGKIKNITRVSVLSAIAFILMYFQFPLAFLAPPFMQVDISDVPCLIGSFAMGPVYGIIIEFLKNLLHLLIQGTMTAGVGEFSNFLLGSIFVGFAGTFYRREKTYHTAVLGLILGTIGMSLGSVLSNYFVVFPVYGKIMGMDLILEMGATVNADITSLFTMMIYAVLPFNLIKCSIASILTLLIYKRVSPFLHE